MAIVTGGLVSPFTLRTTGAESPLRPPEILRQVLDDDVKFIVSGRSAFLRHFVHDLGPLSLGESKASDHVEPVTSAADTHGELSAFAFRQRILLRKDRDRH